MSIPHILFQLFLEPLLFLFQLIFYFSVVCVGHPVLALIPLSLVVNFLALPLYHRADAIRDETRALEAKMKPGLDHIKKTFHGDERYMMQMAYYRINHYSPVFTLRHSLSLLLQIPFFITAYLMLSNHPAFQGLSFGPIKDLSAPDQLINVAGISINLLPIIMTGINLISGVVYSRHASKMDNIQVFGLAIVFFLLLYNSASALVIYWILNQLFSLCKNIVDTKRKSMVALQGSTKESTEFVKWLKTKTRSLLPHRRESSKSSVFLLEGLFLAILVGGFLPSEVIKSSPSEFMTAGYYVSPYMIILNACFIAVGMFIIWTGVYYYISKGYTRKFMEYAGWLLLGIAIVDSMFFGTHLGMLSSQLIYEVEPVFSSKEVVGNIVAIVVVSLVLHIVYTKRHEMVKPILTAIVLIVGCMTFYNCVSMYGTIDDSKMLLSKQVASERTHFRLSKTGKNVVVLMLDRAMGFFVPYLFHEKPILEKQFAGFKWYPNTISFGPNTKIASSALFGGYEYTPVKFNERSTEPWGKKHDEALRLMPVLFDEAGYQVTVCDPPYAGCSWIPDLSIYIDHPNIHTYNTMQEPSRDPFETVMQKQARWNKIFFRYAFMKIAPIRLYNPIYMLGSYHDNQAFRHLCQILLSPSISSGVYKLFMDSYAVLNSLSGITDITEEQENTFLMLTNCTTHEVMLLSEPSYEPSLDVDNTEYDNTHRDRFTMAGKTLTMELGNQMAHYHSNMAALLKIGEWLNYLRSEGVYDNTRIIIVSDHGNGLDCHEDLLWGEDIYENVEWYNPLLMVKDFNSTEFRTDNTFMTNADTPTMAFKDLISNPVNPATGNSVDNMHKNANELKLYYTDNWQINNSNTYTDGNWIIFKNHNVFDINNWETVKTDKKGGKE